MTRLVDLEPRLTGTLEDGWLMFRCPTPGARHLVRIPVGRSCADGKWAASGECPDSLTIVPSIREQVGDGEGGWVVCWHGHVTAGEISSCPDSLAHSRDAVR
jgi:hypothetical protein